MHRDDQEEFDTLEDILSHIKRTGQDQEFDWMTWVGKNYSKGALIRDLEKLSKKK